MLQAAELTLPYAEITDIGPVINSRTDGYFPFQFKRIGLTENINYTITVKPLDSLLFASTGPAKVMHYPSINTIYTDSIAYSLKPGIQIGQPYRFIWQINNGLTIFRDTVTKYYGWETVLLSDSCNTIDNWTSPKWNITTKASHSAPYSITDSPGGAYGNNTNYSVTLKNPLDPGQSPVTVIQYWVRYSIEKSMDYCQFATSSNDGSTWTKQTTRYTNKGSTNQDFPNPVYDGNRLWSQDRVVLNSTTGDNILAKFTIRSDGDGVVKDGMYLDDFRVSIVDMTYIGIDPAGRILGFISGPVPNPANAEVSVRYQLPGASDGSGSWLPGTASINTSFQLLDTRGIPVKEIPLTSSSGTVKLNVSDLPSGVYLYRIAGSFGTTSVKKLVVAH